VSCWKVNQLKKYMLNVNVISMKINDVSINLIIGVIFLIFFSPKGHIISQAPPTLTLWLQYKESTCMLVFFYFFIFEPIVFLIIPR